MKSSLWRRVGCAPPDSNPRQAHSAVHPDRKIAPSSLLSRDQASRPCVLNSGSSHSSGHAWHRRSSAYPRHADSAQREIVEDMIELIDASGWSTRSGSVTIGSDPESISRPNQPAYLRSLRGVLDRIRSDFREARDADRYAVADSATACSEISGFTIRLVHPINWHVQSDGGIHE
jgi:hypothetical protein